MSESEIDGPSPVKSVNISRLEDLLKLSVDEFVFEADGVEFKVDLAAIKDEQGFCELSALMDEILNEEEDQPINCSAQAIESSQPREERLPGDIDIGFLFASPIALFNQRPGQANLELVKFPQIRWQDELKKLKDQVKRSELQLKVKAQVCSCQTLIDVLKKSPRVLHISCHGFKEDGLSQTRSRQMGLSNLEIDPVLEQSSLLFETEKGEADLVSAHQISNLLARDVPMLDLVVLQCCHSEIVGRVFQKHCARHVICIDRDSTVLDEACIAFTHNLYQNLLDGNTICQAFEKAVREAQFALKNEAELHRLFKLLLFEKESSGSSKRKQHKCGQVITRQAPRG